MLRSSLSYPKLRPGLRHESESVKGIIPVGNEQFLLMAPPLSAFAARKVSASIVHPRSQSSTSASEATNTGLKLQNDESYRAANPRLQKRRKTDKDIKHTKDKAGSAGQSPRVKSTTARSLSDYDVLYPDSSSIIGEKAISVTDLSLDSFDSDSLDSPAQAVRQLCSFVPSHRNIIAETSTDWTVVLRDGDSLALIGQYDLWVRDGAISIHGAILHAGSTKYRINAPSTHSLPIIKPAINPYGAHGQSAEVQVMSCRSRIRLLQEISSEFGRIWNGPIDEGRSSRDATRRSFALLQTSADDAFRRPLYGMSPSADWQTAIQSILAQEVNEERPMVLVCGPKGSGKSTFCRTMVNTALTQSRSDPQLYPTEHETKSAVALFDIDPGQPEYVLPGQVALVELQHCSIGPPFTHPELVPSSGSRVVQRQCYGSLSPKDDPTHYLDCVLTMYESYRNLLYSRSNIPTIINCSGWIQGGGLELLVQLVERLHVSDVVYISDGSGPENVMETLAKVCSDRSTRLHPLKTDPPQAVSRTAAELRVMQTLSYFHLAEPEGGELRWNPKPLQEMAPIVIHYAGPQQCILAVMVLGDEQSPEFLEGILEGCLVDIVVVEGDAALPEMEDTSNHKADLGQKDSPDSDNHENSPDQSCHPSILRSPTLIPYLPARDHFVHPLPPKYTHSVGQALIRSIDTIHHQFHLLIPVHFVLPRIRQHPKQKIILVRGKLDTPTWAYKEPIELEKGRLRRREEYSGNKEGVDEEEMKHFIQDVPWAGLTEGKRSAGAKKRSGRRDLRYKSQAKSE